MYFSMLASNKALKITTVYCTKPKPIINCYKLYYIKVTAIFHYDCGYLHIAFQYNFGWFLETQETLNVANYLCWEFNSIEMFIVLPTCTVNIFVTGPVKSTMWVQITLSYIFYEYL